MTQILSYLFFYPFFDDSKKVTAIKTRSHYKTFPLVFLDQDQQKKHLLIIRAQKV